MAHPKVSIIGGGLAGSEAAWQAARRGVPALLYEMRPRVPTPAHQTDRLAELGCSNSLKSDRENTAPWLLQEEMRRAGSLLLPLRGPGLGRPPGSVCRPLPHPPWRPSRALRFVARKCEKSPPKEW